MLMLVTLIGCGSSDGSATPPGDKLLTALSTNEIASYCSYQVDVEMAPRTVDCGNGLKVMLKSQAECEASFRTLPASCTATVAQAEACVTALGANPCDFTVAACAELVQCVGG